MDPAPKKDPKRIMEDCERVFANAMRELFGVSPAEALRQINEQLAAKPETRDLQLELQLRDEEVAHAPAAKDAPARASSIPSTPSAVPDAPPGGAN